MSENTPQENTDRELWREVEGDYYAPSLFVTEPLPFAKAGIGMNVAGSVIVMPVYEWHKLAERHCESFGFTREDVDALRACTDPVLNSDDAGWHAVEHRDRLTAIADRIAALLPPTGH